MLKVLFVDDDASVLSGLKRMLRSLRADWQMAFAQSGRDALVKLSEQPFDILVTDLKMPEMSGVELLTKVKANYPKTIRFALSGYADMEMQLECTQTAHQFIAKPADAELLKSAIARAYSLRSLISDLELQKLIGGVRSLPSVPQLYHELLHETASEDASIKKVGEIISKDPAMTAKLLQLANSAFFGLGRRVDSALQAASYLGVDRIKSLVISINLFSSYEAMELSGVDLQKLALQGQLTGLLAQRIAQEQSLAEKDCNYALMAGMLCDVGKLVLAGSSPRTFESTSFIDSYHARIGAYLLGVWGLPDPIVEAVAFHHSPQSVDENHFSLVSVVHVADALVHEHINSKGDNSDLSPLDFSYLEAVGKAHCLEKWRELVVTTLNRETI